MSKLDDNLILNKVNKLEKDFQGLNKLFEFNKILNFASYTNELLEKVIQFIEQEFNPENIGVFVNQEESFKLVKLRNIETAGDLEFSDFKEVIWDVIKKGQPFQIKNNENTNTYNSFFEKYNITDINAALWLPIVADNHVYAIISIGEKANDQKYNQSDYDFLEKMTETLLPAYVKLHKQEEREDRALELQKSLHNISILYNISQASNFIDDLKKLLKIILDKAITTINAQKGSLMLYDNATNELVIKVVHGLPDKEVEEKINKGLIECTRIKAGEGIAGEVFVSHKAIISNLGDNDPRFKKNNKSNVSSILCIPLITKGEAIGIINITNKYNEELFNQDDLNFMGALANQAAIAINNAQLYELATKDGLTKLYIHRHFYHLLDTEIKRASRYHHNFSLALLDIDDFKLVNDTYGHQTGDEILRRISSVITQTCRTIDIPARYGGEEFVVILPETKKENARIFAQRLRANVEKIEVFAKDGSTISPTVSVGLASFPDDTVEQDELIEFADKSMYFAKKNNKNCVAQYNKDGIIILDK